MKDEGGFAQVGILGILTVVFITLKVIGEITWPWIWVLVPVWGGIALTVVILIVFFIFAAKATSPFEKYGFF